MIFAYHCLLVCQEKAQCLGGKGNIAIKQVPTVIFCNAPILSIVIHFYRIQHGSCCLSIEIIVYVGKSRWQGPVHSMSTVLCKVGHRKL